MTGLPTDPACSPSGSRTATVTHREALGVWIYVGFNSFGGPAGQIAVMHRVLVEEKKWVSEERFMHALNYCMLLPGPEAQQLSIYIGWLLHKTLGGLVAGILFVLPGALAMLGLSVMYASCRDVGFVEAIFFGIKPAVLAIVIEAVQRIGKRALKGRVMLALASTAYLCIFFLEVPFPWIVLGAGLVGLAGARLRPELFVRAALHETKGSTARAVDDVLDGVAPDHTRPSLARAIRVLAIGLFVWFAPLIVIGLARGKDSVFLQEGRFFSQAAVVTFGGAYAVLSYVAQEAVHTYGWLQPGQMLDGLGLAESTPGPLILVTQFVGFMGAYTHPGSLDPLVAGALGSAITLWATFVPCFLWIFLGAPYIESLRGNKALNGALSAITAAVVGVILNLAVWFALHTLFARVEERHTGSLRILVPEWGSLSWTSLAIAAGAMAAILRFKAGMLWTIASSALAGLIIRAVSS